MKYCAKRLIWIGLVTLLKCQVASAAVHNISQGQLPICNNWNNSWSISGSTYTCSDSVSFVAGDEYVANSPITLRADAGITLSGNKIGSVASPIALQTTYGALNATAGSSVVYGNLTTESGALVLAGVSLVGNIQTAGTVTIDNSSLSGTVNGSGRGTIRNSSVSGAVAFNNGLTGVNAVFSSTLTSTNGSVNLSGGSVAGLVNVSCCKVTVSQGATISNGIVAGNNGIDIRDSTVTGDLKAGNNPIIMVNVNMTSGSISPGNNSLTITGGTVTADVTNAHRVFISDNAVVTGDVLARYEVSVSDSKVVGDIETVVGHDGLHHVYLTNSEVYGNVTVRDDWGTINGDELSRIYGECTYQLVDPITLCEPGGGPGPIDPVECKAELHVKHMIAGLQQQAKVVVVDEPGCEKPDSLDFIFGYVSPEDPPVKASLVLNGVDLLVQPKISLSFDDDGEADLNIEYNEAGRLWLKIDAEDQVKKEFVSRPYGLCLETDLNHARDLLFQGKDGGEPIHSAGDTFDLRIRAVAWRDDAKDINDVREADAICNNPPVLNYRQYFDEKTGERNIGLEPILIEPDLEGGALKVVLGRTAHDHTDAGQMTLSDQSISEVGIFMIKARPPEYLGADMTHAISLSSRIGRFVPAWLGLDATLSQNVGCPHPSLPAGNFTYQGQPVDLVGGLNVQGFNKSGQPTHNYIDDFWRLSGELRANVEELEDLKSYDFRQIFITPGQEPASTDRVTSSPIFKAKPDSAAFYLANEEGEFIPTYNYSYARSGIPSDRDKPFRLELVVEDWHDLDGVYFKTTGESPESGWGAGAPSMPVSALIENSEFRLGRIRTENVIHTGLGVSPITVDVPLFLEHWEGGRFEADADGCTDIASAVVSHTGNLVNPEIVEQVDFSSNPPVESVWARFSTEEGGLRGTANLKHLLTKDAVEKPYWLCQEGIPVQGGICTYSKNEAGAVEEVRADATVTFGIYKGPTPLIFRRELYR